MILGRPEFRAAILSHTKKPSWMKLASVWHPDMCSHQLKQLCLGIFRDYLCIMSICHMLLPIFIQKICYRFLLLSLFSLLLVEFLSDWVSLYFHTFFIQYSDLIPFGICGKIVVDMSKPPLRSQLKWNILFCWFMNSARISFFTPIIKSCLW